MKTKCVTWAFCLNIFLIKDLHLSLIISKRFFCLLKDWCLFDKWLARKTHSISFKRFSHFCLVFTWEKCRRRYQGFRMTIRITIAQVCCSLTANEVAFGYVHWGAKGLGKVSAGLLAACVWIRASFAVHLKCQTWVQIFSLHIFGKTNVVIVGTGYLCLILFTFIPTHKRDTVVAFHGIICKK